MHAAKIFLDSKTIHVLIAICILLFALPASSRTVGSEEDGLTLEHAKMDLHDNNYQKAYTSFSAVARHGHAQAQHISGMMCEKGYGTKRSMSRAISYYKQAAAQGCAESESALGHMYLVGNEALKKDTDQGLSWLEKAASHNNPQAQHTLGKLYAAGEVVPQDLAKAGQWLKAAAANGVKEAEEALAKLPSVPMPGGGTEKNPLGVVGENYGHGLQTLKQSWGGYRDAIRELDQATRN